MASRSSTVAFLAACLIPAAGQAADPSALWKIVNGKCVPGEQASRDPSPCTAVNLSQGAENGFVILKDLNGIAQFLLIPTTRIGGIEDGVILAPNATNYWDAAWQARYYVESRLHTNLPRDGFALAINSTAGRTQDQLHIHIDCINPDVRAALAANLASVGSSWAPFPVPLAGHTYRAIRLNQDTLDGINPFRVLAGGGDNADTDMGMHTLVLVGETFADGASGFLLLDDLADLAAGDRASGEELEDHACAIAQK